MSRPRKVSEKTAVFLRLRKLHSQKPHATRENDEKVFDDRFILFDEDTDTPMPNTEYAIRRANGHLEFGVTDAEGRTHLLTTTAEAESVDIYS